MQYFEQLECLYSELDHFFKRMREAGIYDDSIIIIHGDHGSRIFINEPTDKNQHLLTTQDLVDGFSTLFAMKLPGTAARYDKALVPLEQLFAKFAFEAGLTSTNVLSEQSDAYVYLITDDSADPIRIPYIPN
jgi:phosphoglycerol transferase MdoB-like AlkP superfamily enzyme